MLVFRADPTCCSALARVLRDGCPLSCGGGEESRCSVVLLVGSAAAGTLACPKKVLSS